MRVIRDAGGADEDWLAAHTVGWPELSARLDEWPVERAAADLRAAGGRHRRASASASPATRPSTIMIGLGLQRHGGAGSAVRAIMSIPAVTGDWRHVGGGLSGMTGGHFPSLSAYAGAKAAGIVLPAGRAPSTCRASARPCTSWTTRRCRRCVIFNCNPAATSPDARRVRERHAARRPVHGRARAADDRHRRPRRHRPARHHAARARRPPRLVRPPLPVVERAGRAAPGRVPVRTPRSSAASARASGSTIRRCRSPTSTSRRSMLAQAGTDLGRDPRRGLPAHRAAARLGAVRRGRLPDRERQGRARTRRRSSTPAATACRPTRSRTRRSTTSSPSASRSCCSRPPAGSSSTRRSRSSTGIAARRAAPTIWLHPDDAAMRGLVDGDTVRCHNDRGAWTAALAVSDATRPGVCFTLKTQWPKLSPAART